MNAGTIRTEIELLFRRESGRLTAVLTRILGPHNLSLAEDVVQESFIAALDHWSAGGIPDNAPAWLLTTARRRAIDLIRRERTRRRFAPDLAVFLDQPSVSNSSTVALLALMCFAAARLDSRIDDSGRLVPLDQQDRSLWDRTLIDRGFSYLQQSSQMEALWAGPYHLEAAIASRHCSAATFGDTDWPSICNLYDRLLEIAPTPLTSLNRAVAISYRSGPQAGIDLIEGLDSAGVVPHGHVVAASLAHLYARAGQPERARGHLEAALARARTEHERRLIELQVSRATGSP
jgi:predicted RNA polymerase sigma factor